MRLKQTNFQNTYLVSMYVRTRADLMRPIKFRILGFEMIILFATLTETNYSSKP